MKSGNQIFTFCPLTFWSLFKSFEVKNVKLPRFVIYIRTNFFFYTFRFCPDPTTDTAAKVEEDGGVFEIKSRLVIVPVSVLDATGQPVLGLKAQDFRVSEENNPQEIAQVSDAEKVPLEIALLIDVSGSVNPLFELEKKAAAQFLESVMKPEDRATIFLIGDAPVLTPTRDTAATGGCHEFAQSSFQANLRLFTIRSRLAAAYLQKNAPQRSRRVILALTDGEDNWSNLTREQEKTAVKNIDVNKLNE